VFYFVIDIAPMLCLQVRIMFEVQDLRYATLATVSRCGMVWFSEDVLSTDMIFEHYIQKLRYIPLEETEEDARYAMQTAAGTPETKEEQVSPTLQVQRDAAAVLVPYFALDGIIIKCLEFCHTLDHIMDFTRFRALNSLFSMLNQGVRNVLAYNRTHDFPMQVRQFFGFVFYHVFSLLWSCMLHVLCKFCFYFDDNKADILTSFLLLVLTCVYE
jgi:dynein heavy chain 1